MPRRKQRKQDDRCVATIHELSIFCCHSPGSSSSQSFPFCCPCLIMTHSLLILPTKVEGARTAQSVPTAIKTRVLHRVLLPRLLILCAPVVIVTRATYTPYRREVLVTEWPTRLKTIKTVACAAAIEEWIEWESQHFCPFNFILGGAFLRHCII